MLQQNYYIEQPKPAAYANSNSTELFVLVRDYGIEGKSSPEGVYSNHELAMNELRKREPQVLEKYPFASISPSGSSFRRSFIDTDGWYILKYELDADIW